jgi:acetyl esterase/lipase
MSGRRNSRDVLEEPPARDCSHVSYGDGSLAVAELRLPEGAGPHPLLIVLHGGYWRTKYDRAHLAPLCRAVTAGGIATLNVEYRRVGHEGGGWPGTFEDVARAVEAVPELERTHPIDLGRVALFGHSAGGHLALLVATLIPLRGVLAAAAVSDLEAAWARNAGDGAVEAFVGGTPAELPEHYREASPIRRLPLGLPQVLVHGTHDETVPYADSVAYAAAAGPEARLVTLEGAGHFEPVDPLAREWPLVEAEIRALVLG